MWRFDSANIPFMQNKDPSLREAFTLLKLDADFLVWPSN